MIDIRAWMGIVPPTILVAVIGFMGKGMVDNEKANDRQHIEIHAADVMIRKEIHDGDEKVRDKMEVINEKTTDIRIEQSEQRVLLEGIAAKL